MTIERLQTYSFAFENTLRKAASLYYLVTRAINTYSHEKVALLSLSLTQSN